jgi:hypothetical protein
MSKNSPNQSKASWIASQNEAVRAEFYASLTAAERAFLPYDWDFWGRDDQKLPPGDWFVWLILAGRGWGKTRTAVECITRMLLGPTPLIAPPDAPEMLTIVADSPFDMRQYSIERPLGIHGQAAVLGDDHDLPPTWALGGSPVHRALPVRDCSGRMRRGEILAPHAIWTQGATA